MSQPHSRNPEKRLCRATVPFKKRGEPANVSLMRERNDQKDRRIEQLSQQLEQQTKQMERDREQVERDKEQVARNRKQMELQREQMEWQRDVQKRDQKETMDLLMQKIT